MARLGAVTRWVERVNRSEQDTGIRGEDLAFHSESHLPAIKPSTRCLMLLKLISFITLGVIIFILQALVRIYLFFAKTLIETL